MLPIGYQTSYPFAEWDEDCESQLRQLVQALEYDRLFLPGEFIKGYPAFCFESGDLYVAIKVVKGWVDGYLRGMQMSLQIQANPIFDKQAGNIYVQVVGRITDNTPEDEKCYDGIISCLILKESESRYRVYTSKLEGVGFGGFHEIYWFTPQDEALKPVLQQLLMQLTIEPPYRPEKDDDDLSITITRMVKGTADKALTAITDLFDFSSSYFKHISKIEPFRNVSPPLRLYFCVNAAPCFRLRNEQGQLDIRDERYEIQITIAFTSGSKFIVSLPLALCIIRREGGIIFRVFIAEIEKEWSMVQTSLRFQVLNDGIALSDFINAYQNGDEIVYSRLGYAHPMPDPMLMIEPFPNEEEDE